MRSVAVSLRPEGDGFAVCVTNERREDFRGTAECVIRDVKGRRAETCRMAVFCPAMGSAAAGTVRKKGMDFPIVQAVLRDENNQEVSETEALLPLPKHFPFEKPSISINS